MKNKEHLERVTKLQILMSGGHPSHFDSGSLALATTKGALAEAIAQALQSGASLFNVQIARFDGGWTGRDAWL